MAKKATKKKENGVEHKPFKINLGAGMHPVVGFVGCDRRKFPGIEHVFDLAKKWPFKDNSVDEACCHHVLEHLTNWNDKWERVAFFNELYRVLKPGGKIEIIVPDWTSDRFWGDPTHKEPLGSMTFQYLNKEWRKKEAPDTDGDLSPGPHALRGDLDFVTGYGYTLNPELAGRSNDYITHAHTFDVNARMDMIATLTKKPIPPK